jgi:hypothetical protein
MRPTRLAVILTCLAAALGLWLSTKMYLPQAAASPMPPTSGNASSAVTYFPDAFQADVVVSNTDPNLKNTDMFFNSEPGIAVDPNNPLRMVVFAFSGAWSALGDGSYKNAPLWYSQNGGFVWTKEFSIPSPTGLTGGKINESPCDETFAFDRHGVLYGSFLLDGPGQQGSDCSSGGGPTAEDVAGGGVISGATSDPASPQAWQWFVMNGVAQYTNHYPSADQPWLFVGADPLQPSQDNVYIPYQTFTTMQVAVAKAQLPPDFAVDNSPGPEVSQGWNSGHRGAFDPTTGAIYSLWQTAATIECSSSFPIRYTLNRSTDGGQTWGLNGSKTGIAAAEACSHQHPKLDAFGQIEPRTVAGGVNALKGGIDALAVDPNTGDVYVVFGDYDEAANRDRIGIVRLTRQADGSLQAGPSHFVSGPEHMAALPAVAVAHNAAGSVAVLYDTADALDENLKPYLSVHLAVSQDHGATFQTTLLQTFLFPDNAPPCCDGARPLGDYQQLKSQGATFYGVYAGDGQPFGRPFHKIDPIFVKTSVR